MSEIRVTSVVGENGGDRVGLTTGLTVGPLTGTTGIGATISHQGHAQFAGVCTATSFVGNGAGLTNVSAGKILQVKQTVKTDVSTTTSSSFSAIPGLSVSITPSSSSSKVLITVDTKIGTNGGGCYIKLLRDSTDIYVGDTVSGKTPCLQQTYGGSDTGEGQYGMAKSGGTFLDSPATTSAVTYSVHWKRENSATMYINRSASDSGAYVGRGASSITAMEVEA